MSENNITNVKLTPYEEIVKGEVGVSSFIVNDYIINIIENNSGYTLEIIKGSQVQSVTIDGPTNIENVIQVATSHESGGVNTIRVILSDGSFSDFDIYNGEKGEKGDPGITPAERQEILNNEATRVEAENDRIDAESDRVLNEEDRVLKETLRNGAEAERIQQEKNRNSGESSRDSAESNRVSAENIRVYNENNRQTAEENRASEWEEIKDSFNTSIQNLVQLENDVEDLSDKVDTATADVLEAYLNVNNHIEESKGLLQEIEEASSDIINLSVVSDPLAPGNIPYVNYEDGVMVFGIPKGEKGDPGDSFHIVKTYSSVVDMHADYTGTDVSIGEFVMVVSNVEDPDNAKVYIKGQYKYEFVVDMSGATGIQGPRGPQGVSPEVATQSITGGHRVVITGDFSPQQFDVMNGEDGTSVTGIDFNVDDDGVLKYQIAYDK